MKKTFKLRAFIFAVIFSFLFGICPLNAELQPPLPAVIEPNISMDFQDANLKDILKVFSMQSGLNFIASEALQDRRVTLYLDKVPLNKAMDKLFAANNLTYELDRDANIFVVKDWGKPEAETITKIFYLKYATVSSSSLKEQMKSLSASTTDTSTSGGGGGGGATSEGGKWKAEDEAGITSVVKNMLSSYGTVMEDFRTNSLIVTDTPAKMEVIAKVIASLDIPASQVILEVEMLDVSKNKVDKMGLNWGSAGSYAMQVVSASRGTSFPLSMFNPSDARVGGPVSPGTLSFPTTLKVILDFLKTQTDTKYLARPRLLTLNNETAEIKIVTQESVGVKTSTSSVGGTGTTTAEPERVETGVSLRITPQINADTGEITMAIYPQVSEAAAGSQLTVGGETYQYRDPEQRFTKSVVRIKDGDTVIIGGLIRNEFYQSSTKIPILGDIPILGALFRHKGGGTSSSDKNKERELLVFITPHIVKDTSIELAQAKKVALPGREQNTVSGFNRDLAVTASLNNFEKRKK
ncbi:MAG: hypothetical protein FJZ13_02845 [Candidatus Omnitrophica bacterium]|nr:hypothetical protein [Candidatus Omnitrophota bacterium]